MVIHKNVNLSFSSAVVNDNPDREKVYILTAFRDREEHKKIFLPFMNDYLTKKVAFLIGNDTTAISHKDFTYKDFTYNNNTCDIKYRFLFTVISKVVY